MLQSLLNDARIFLSLVLLSIIIILLDNQSILNLPKSLLQNITIPIQYGLYKSSHEGFRQFEFITIARRASQEKRAQDEQMANILSENAELRKKVSELQAQVDQKNALDSQNFIQVTARPVGINRFLFIDRGSDDGIKVGQPVIFKNNYIGTIKEVSPKKSSVILPSDPDSHISAFVSGADGKAKGILEGQFGSEMLLDKVLHAESVKEKDLVYTEGTEVEVPRGLILGEVSEVLQRENEVFKQAKVKPIFDISDLDLVFVVIN